MLRKLATIAVSIQCVGGKKEPVVPSPDPSTRTASSRRSALVSGDESVARGVSTARVVGPRCFPIDSNDPPLRLVPVLCTAASVVSRASVSPSKFVCSAVGTIAPLG